MAVDFKSLISKPVEDAKRPPSLPAGLYFGSITAYEWAESRFENRETKEKDAVCRYSLRISHAGEDVDKDRLNGIDLAKRKLTRDMPVSGGNEWVTRVFLESLGVPISGKTFGECCPEAVNASVQFEITERPNEKDPDAPAYNDIRALRAPAA